VVGHDLLDAFEVDVEVSVRCDLAEAVALPPRDIWVPILEVLAELGGPSATWCGDLAAGSPGSRGARAGPLSPAPDHAQLGAQEPDSLLTIAAEIGEIERLASPEKLTGYTGLCPRVV
jgi:hypothetical protein